MRGSVFSVLSVAKVPWIPVAEGDQDNSLGCSEPKRAKPQEARASKIRSLKGSNNGRLRERPRHAKGRWAHFTQRRAKK
jgi:hypothetical protein